MKENTLQNEDMRNRVFLETMLEDKYYPKETVKKVQEVLTHLCVEIEAQQPQGLEDLYSLTHAATEKINDLEEEFDANGSEIETVARENIAEEFEFIANAYGFEDADIEELIEPREW